MSKFPFYKQLDGMDCGPSCLRMIAKYYGKTFSVQQLREQSYIQRTGVNLLGISEAAASIGLRATGIRTSMEKLKQQSKLPCIIHWNQFAATGLPFSYTNHCRPRHRAQESEFYTAHFGRTTHAGIQPHTY